jgi:membrane associated rhomboid family serine protease
VRKRAPRLDRGEAPEEPRRRRTKTRRMPSLGRIRRDEIPGIAPDTRPYATIVLIALCIAVNVAIATNQVSYFDLGALLPGHNAVWRYFATPFLHANAGYELVTLATVAIFGTHLERRFGPAAPVILFVACGAAGAYAAIQLSDSHLPLGANGAALGLLCAWVVDDRLAARRGEDRGNDLLGVIVIGAVLLLLPLMTGQASAIAGVTGGLVGAALGVPLSVLVRR